MLSREEQIRLFGGPLLTETVRVGDTGWGIETPTIRVEGHKEMAALIQGGLHSDLLQLPHKCEALVLRGFPTVCLSQSGASTVRKLPNFYDTGDFERFVERDVAILNAHGLERVIAYGSSIGGPAAIALAAEHPERVAAVIAVNPASLIDQTPWRLGLKFALSALSRPEKDFVPPVAPWPSIREMGREMFGKVKNLAASDVGLSYLKRVKCPILIYAGKKANLFPWRRLKELEALCPEVDVRVIVVDDFIHSDPNSRAKIGWLVDDAMERFQHLGFT